MCDMIRLGVRSSTAGTLTAALSECPACDAVDGVAPALELRFLELEVGPPAGAPHETPQGALLAPYDAEMALVDGIALEQGLDARRKGLRGRRGLRSPLKRSATPVENSKDHGSVFRDRLRGGWSATGEGRR
jgi:hypothetical protein